MYLSKGSGTPRARSGEPVSIRPVPLTRTKPGPEYKSMYTRVGHLFFMPVEKSRSYNPTSVYFSSAQALTDTNFAGIWVNLR
jgi:hypothetical protein